MTEPLSDETNEERFARVAAIFDAAGFLKTLDIRLDALVPDGVRHRSHSTRHWLQQHGCATAA